jgi:hypothetical protein
MKEEDIEFLLEYINDLPELAKKLERSLRKFVIQPDAPVQTLMRTMNVMMVRSRKVQRLVHGEELRKKELKLLEEIADMDEYEGKKYMYKKMKNVKIHQRKWQKKIE